nr:hypothetical protein [Paracoccaceae bacterium]
LPATAEMWRRYIAEKDASELGLEAFDDCDEEIRDAVAKVAAVQNDSAEFTETCLTLTRSYEDLISRLFSQGQDPDLALHLAESHIGRTYACVGRALGWFTSLAPGTMLSVNIHQGRVWQKR